LVNSFHSEQAEICLPTQARLAFSRSLAKAKGLSLSY